MSPTPLDHSAVKGGNVIQALNPLAIADWDGKISKFSGATFFHSAAWARVLSDSYGYQPVYLTHVESNHFEALLPLMEVNSWLTGRRGVSLPFTDSCEPLCPDVTSFKQLFAAATEYGIKRNWKYLECRGGRQWMNEVPVSTCFFNHLLNLTPAESSLWLGLSENTRRAVRKGQRSGLTVEFAQTLDAVRIFYALLCETRKRHGVPPQPFDFFANIYRHVLSTGKGRVIIIRKDSHAVAGAMFFHFGRAAIYKFGASAAPFQHFRPNNLVMWEAIRRYKVDGFESMDFGRTSLTNDGLRQFKLGWGTQESHVDYARFLLPTGKFVPAVDQSSGHHTRFFNFLPISVSKIAGRFLYRHLG